MFVSNHTREPANATPPIVATSTAIRYHAKVKPTERLSRIERKRHKHPSRKFRPLQAAPGLVDGWLRPLDTALRDPARRLHRRPEHRALPGVPPHHRGARHLPGLAPRIRGVAPPSGARTTGVPSRERDRHGLPSASFVGGRAPVGARPAGPSIRGGADPHARGPRRSDKGLRLVPGEGFRQREVLTSSFSSIQGSLAAQRSRLGDVGGAAETVHGCMELGPRAEAWAPGRPTGEAGGPEL